MIRMLPRRLATFGAAVLVTASCAPPVPFATEAERTPAQAMAGLLAADRVFSSVTAGVDLGDGYMPMFAPDVVMPVPGGRGFAVGRAQVIAELQGTAADARSRLSWEPASGGISADGQHGFTWGYMSLRRPDSSSTGFKYLAYWVQQPEGWRIVAYRRIARAAGTVVMPAAGPAIPARLVAATTDATTISEFHVGLDRAERDFSARAQVAGLGPAFAEYGTPDAAFLGDSTTSSFIIGAEAIARDVSAGDPPGASPVSWAPDRVLVASSGDLGLSIGTIRLNDTAVRSRPMPFFTVWRRAGPDAPWRYVAE